MTGGPGYRESPNHEVRVERANGRWRAAMDGRILAESRDALVIYETGYPPAVYFPPDDVRRDELAGSESTSYCPFKGRAAYLSRDGVDIAWLYPDPYDEVEAIRGRVAFYRDHVDVRSVD